MGGGGHDGGEGGVAPRCGRPPCGRFHLLCPVLSPPPVSAAAGAEVAGGVARRNTERIAGDSLLVLSGAPDFLVVAAIILSFILMD